MATEIEEPVVMLTKYDKYIKPRLVDPEFKEKRMTIIRKWNNTKYHDDPEFREKQLQRAKEYYLRNKEMVKEKDRERYLKNKAKKLQKFEN